MNYQLAQSNISVNSQHPMRRHVCSNPQVQSSSKLDPVTPTADIAGVAESCEELQINPLFVLPHPRVQQLSEEDLLPSEYMIGVSSTCNSHGKKLDHIIKGENHQLMTLMNRFL